jgi:hypothetical protein
MSAGLAPERLRVCMYLCICVACEKYVLLFSVYAPRERRISRQVRNEARVKTRGFSGLSGNVRQEMGGSLKQ